MADYNKLASLIGTHQELTIFRKFGALNAKSLLYMQSELHHLQSELEGIEQENKYSGDGEKLAFQVSLFDLKDSEGTTKDLQWRKVLEIRDKLKAYNEALLRFQDLQKLQKPGGRDVKLLQEWLERPEGGDFFLRGREAEIWEAEKDLVTLSSASAEKDSLTRLITDRMIPWYHCRWGHRIQKRASDENWNGLWHYDEAPLLMAANSISTVLSSLLPTTSILILYFVKKPLARLAVTMLFTALFSLTLATVAKARRIDVFAATTAFAAVQVVFLGQTGFCNA